MPRPKEGRTGQRLVREVAPGHTSCPCPRHWQDLGYLIIYVTGRPDMQKQRVVAWLAQHNFPHGVVSFCDGLVHDPLRHKANFLKLLITEVRPWRVWCGREDVTTGVGGSWMDEVWVTVGVSSGGVATERCNADLWVWPSCDGGGQVGPLLVGLVIGNTGCWHVGVAIDGVA